MDLKDVAWYIWATSRLEHNLIIRMSLFRTKLQKPGTETVDTRILTIFDDGKMRLLGTLWVVSVPLVMNHRATLKVAADEKHWGDIMKATVADWPADWFGEKLVDYRLTIEEEVSLPPHSWLVLQHLAFARGIISEKYAYTYSPLDKLVLHTMDTRLRALIAQQNQAYIAVASGF